MAIITPKQNNFNPRTPCGVRPSSWANTTRTAQFQSTHPLRGATCKAILDRRIVYISIHAPLAGCDTLSSTGSSCTSTFQSTHPLRGATPSATASTAPWNFNPRTPCGVRRVVVVADIVVQHFNPRTPCGVRPAGNGAAQSPCRFQSTHPLRGATEVEEDEAPAVDISIHAPLAGCDA